MKMFNSFETWLPISLNFIIVIVALCTLFVAIGSLITSSHMMKQSQKQFETNAKHSQTQFDSNAERSRQMFEDQQRQAQELSEALMTQVTQLQKITQQQLEASELQLMAQKELLTGVQESEQPLVVIEHLNSSVYLRQNGAFFDLQPRYSNVGGRRAYNFTLYTFLVYGDLSTVLRKMTKPTDLDPEMSSRQHYEWEFPKMYEDNFYICHVLMYTDKTLNRQYRDYLYFKHVKKNQTLVDWNQEGDKIRKVVDLHIK